MVAQVLSSKNFQYSNSMNDEFENQQGFLGTKEVKIVPTSYMSDNQTLCFCGTATVFFTITLVVGIILWSVGATALPMSAAMILSGKILVGIGSLPITLTLAIATEGRVCVFWCP